MKGIPRNSSRDRPETRRKASLVSTTRFSRTITRPSTEASCNCRSRSCEAYCPSRSISAIAMPEPTTRNITPATIDATAGLPTTLALLVKTASCSKPENPKKRLLVSGSASAARRAAAAPWPSPARSPPRLATAKATAINTAAPAPASPESPPCQTTASPVAMARSSTMSTSAAAAVTVAPAISGPTARSRLLSRVKAARHAAIDRKKAASSSPTS